VHVDTWRSAYRGIVPDLYLDGLSYEESERLWQDAIAAGAGCVFVAQDEGGIFGFASGGPRERFSRELEEYAGELQTVYVLPSHKGTGAGGRLVGAVARHLEDHGVHSMLLWVFAENQPARGFYESLGGVPVAEDGFELGGAWLTEVAYGWQDPGVLPRGHPGARWVWSWPPATGRRLCDGTPWGNGVWARRPSPGLSPARSRTACGGPSRARSRPKTVP
jgi:GNAT superfamily N-acetyltransferase